MATLGIYCHLPFCTVKCPYCDFYSIVFKGKGEEEFVSALCREIEMTATTIGVAGCPVDTIYFGGGTPSILAIESLQKILTTLRLFFQIDPQVEITLEANPGTVTEEKFGAFRSSGFNRISMGYQSIFDHHLKILGRDHTAAEAERACLWARRAGFKNISLDFIYALSDQTLAEWEQTLARAIALSPEHISAYCLTIETRTPYALYFQQGRLHLPDEEISRQMFAAARILLAEAGYEHYETSNWAKPGFRSRHNEKYWTDREYLGFGPSAHSFLRNQRWANVRDLKVYTARIVEGKLPRDFIETLSPVEERTEAILLGLRRAEGIDLENYALRFGTRLELDKQKEIERFIRLGYLKRTDGHLQLQAEGWFVADGIMAALA